MPVKLLSAQIEQEFKDFIAHSYGLQIHVHQLEKFRQAIIGICENFALSEPAQLLALLKAEPFCAPQIALIEQITVDESYFFRDDTQQHFLTTELLPQLIAEKRAHGDKQLRIWSAGCATGQEIYSIAILLHRLLIDFSDWNLHLIASDISHKSLERAMQAEYSAWAIRTAEDFIHSSGYFIQRDKNCYQLSAEIRNSVKFFFLNLAENSFPSLINQTCHLDLILCRNVFIYFHTDMIQQVCQRFAAALKPGGVLLLSTADPLNLVPPELKLEKGAADIFYFRRLDFEHQTVTCIPTKPLEPATPDSETKIPSVTEKQTDELPALRREISLLLAAGQWQQALNLCESALLKYPRQAELIQFKAKALINLDQLSEAKTACELSIELDDLDPHNYLLYGLVLIQLSLNDEAETAFRRTIFLNYDFMEAHYQLGQVLLHKGQRQQAIKSIHNALQLAEQGNANRPIHNTFAFTYANFAQLMKNELSLLKRL